MSEGSSDQGPRQSFGPGEGPRLLGQMLASGAWVFGSDGEKVGDLKDVGEAGFTVGRGIKPDLRMPVTSGGDSPGKANDFPESPIREGPGEIFKGRDRGRGRDSEG